MTSQMSLDTKSNEAHVYVSLWIATTTTTKNAFLSPSRSKYGKQIWLSSRKRLQGSQGGERADGSIPWREAGGGGTARAVPLEAFPPLLACGWCALPFSAPPQRRTGLLHPHRPREHSKADPKYPRAHASLGTQATFLKRASSAVLTYFRQTL